MVAVVVVAWSSSMVAAVGCAVVGSVVVVVASVVDYLRREAAAAALGLVVPLLTNHLRRCARGQRGEFLRLQTRIHGAAVLEARFLYLYP